MQVLYAHLCDLCAIETINITKPLGPRFAPTSAIKKKKKHSTASHGPPLTLSFFRKTRFGGQVKNTS